MSSLPRGVQHLLTWMTGKALPGQRPLVRLSPPAYLALTLSCLGGSILLTHWLVNTQSLLCWLLVPVSWLVTVSAARIGSTVVAHHCIHRQFLKRRSVDTTVAQFLSTVLVTEDAKSYFVSHVAKHHNKDRFATAEDPTIVHLLDLGFRPNMPVKQLWAHLFKTLVSPKFHAHFALKRLKMNLVTPEIGRRLSSAVFLALVAVLAYHYSDLRSFTLAYLIPIWPLYHISALLEFLTEHAWFKPIPKSHKDLSFHVSHSWGRFTGRAIPSRDLPAAKRTVAWAKWFLVMLFYHVPCRLLVIPGDLSQHDYHHRFPASKDWVCAAYARQADIDHRHPGWPPYRDVWGIHNAINHVFEILSNQHNIKEGV